MGRKKKDWASSPPGVTSDGLVSPEQNALNYYATTNPQTTATANIYSTLQDNFYIIMMTKLSEPKCQF